MGILGLREILCLVLCSTLPLVYRWYRKPRLPLPPSLPRWPLIGNALQIPSTYPHIFYQELGQKLGSKIMYLEAFGEPIIIINDLNIAKDLLEKRSTLYSSRPHLEMFNEVIGAKDHFAFMPYGDEWRNHRRLFKQYFAPSALDREQEKALQFVRKGLLPNLYKNPRDFHGHIRDCIGSLSLSNTYGLPVQRNHDPLVRLAEESAIVTAAATAPGKYLVNIVPALKYVPEWMPGSTFKKVARKAREKLNQIREEPYRRTLKNIDDGTAPGSFVSASLEKHRDGPNFGYQALHIKQVAVQVYGAAAETTVASTMTFILAMLTHPEVQRKAQCEIDSVVGSDRLPDYSDQPHLPYLSAILREVLRWNPSTPMSIPHLTSAEDAYEGYHIPKGATVLVNTYAILHDEAIFSNPEEFNPDRFIKDGVLLTDVLDPTVNATFGYGRRMCPGAHIALSTLYLVTASILALYDILPELDVEGKPVKVEPKFAPASIISMPLPYECRFIPRKNKNVEDLLQEYMDVEVI